MFILKDTERFFPTGFKPQPLHIHALVDGAINLQGQHRDALTQLRHPFTLTGYAFTCGK